MKGDRQTDSPQDTRKFQHTKDTLQGVGADRADLGGSGEARPTPQAETVGREPTVA